MQAPRIDLQVIPSFRDVERNIAKDLNKLARGFGAELEKQLPKALTDALSKASRDVEKDSAKAAGDIAKARADAISKAIDKSSEDETRATERAVKKQGDLYEGLGKLRQRRAEADLRAFDRARAEEVRATERAEKEQTRISEQAAKERSATALAVAKARQKALSKLATDALREQERNEQELAKARQRAQEEAARQFRGTTAGRAQAGTLAGADAIQDLPVHLDDDNVFGDLQRIRQRIKAMGNLEIGVDIDVENFADNIEREFARLRAIAHDFTVDIDVRTDAAAAATELGAVLVLLNRIDGQDANVDVNVDTDSARARLIGLGQSLEVNLSRLGNLIALGASLGSAIVPAAATAAGAIGFIGTAALSAASGIGVMVLGFGGVFDAVKALNGVADDQAKINKSMVASENQVANAVDGVKSARASLANTIASNRDAAIRANQAVANAERALAKARKEADRDAEEAARKLATTRRKAAQDAVEAAQRVQDAQRALARDERDAQRAREDLTQAYRDAQQAYDDVANAIERNSLDQQQAILDIAQAREELNKVISNPRATEAERRQAQINFERRSLQLKELKSAQQELNDQYEEFTTKGIEGSDQVVSAQERLQAAEESLAKSRRDLVRSQADQQQQLLDSQQAIADAIRDQTDAQTQGQERIAEAEQRLANERRDRESQQRQAAFALAGAQQSLIQSQRTLQNAFAASATAGGAAIDTLNTAMSKLSPTAQRFARFIAGLRDEFFQLRNAAAEGLLSGAQTAITSLLPFLPPLVDFVRRVGNKLGELFVRWAGSLKDPIFQRFFGYISQTAVPTLEDLFTVADNLLRGFIGLFLGFTPLTEDVTGGIVGMSQAFADWAATLDSNTGFQTFLQYIRDNGPDVVDFFEQLIKFGGALIRAMAPIGPVIVEILDGFVNFMTNLPPDVLAAIVAGIAGLAAALGVLSAVTSIAAISSTALLIAAIVAGVAAAIAGIALLFHRVAPLREFFVNLWREIAAGFSAFWQAIQPSLVSLGDSIVRLWKGAFIPAFQGIWEVIKLWWSLVSPALGVVMEVLKLVAGVVFWFWKTVWVPAFSVLVTIITKVFVPVIRWLYNNVIKPVFTTMGIAFNIFAAIAKVALGLVQIGLKVLGAIFLGFYKIFIKPFVDALTPFFRWLGGVIAQWIQPQWDKAIKALGDYWERLRKTARVPIKFVVETLLNDGILKAYNKLADMFNVEPKNVKIPPPRGGWATGGEIDILPGYTPGRDVHTFVSPTGGVIGLSGGEGILRPEVTAMVKPWMDDANRAARQGGRRGVQKFLGGFSRGGVVPGGGDGLGAWWNATKSKAGDLWKGLKDRASDVFEGIKDFASNPAGYLKKVFDKLVKLVPGNDTAFGKMAIGLPATLVATLSNKVKDLFTGTGEGSDGVMSPGGLGGSGGMMQILRRAFPGLPLISGYRPGAITATGRPSMHGKNRAVDLPPRFDVFNWIRQNYPNSHELIFSPAGNRQIYRGQPHVFSGITKQMHYNHVHWSYDQGGWLPDTRQMPGQQMAVFHGRRQPDAVLTSDQWASVSKLVRSVSQTGGGRGDTFQFDFANSTLTADRLSAIQTRRDTLDRINRPNW